MKTIRMSREQHKKWTDALRSGDYQQGTGALCVCMYGAGPRYCCLGVLQHVLDGACEQRGLPSLEWLDKHSIEFDRPDLLGQRRAHTNNPYLPCIGQSAAFANDDGMCFTKIADAIDQCVEFTD